MPISISQSQRTSQFFTSSSAGLRATIAARMPVPGMEGLRCCKSALGGQSKMRLTASTSHCLPLCIASVWIACAVSSATRILRKLWIDVLMKKLDRWSLAVAVLAISGWACFRIPPEHAPAAISKPPAAADRPPPGSAGDPFTGVHRSDAVRALGLGQADKKDWPAQFHAVGSNYFEFVAQAAQAAYEGDGAAQYYIGHAMARCEETNALYQDADSADQAVSHLAFSPAFLDLERREYL